MRLVRANFADTPGTAQIPVRFVLASTTLKSTAPSFSIPAGVVSKLTCLANRESGGDYTINNGNGYTGADQWLPTTWNSAVRGIGLPQYANGRADLAPKIVQDEAAWYWGTRAGWSQWPNTAWRCGL